MDALLTLSLSAIDRVTSTAEDAEETAQIALARKGDQQAFRWLLIRYRERTVRLTARVLRSDGDAEDAAQEAFIRAFKNIHQFKGECRFYTWLYQIAVRVCMDRLRSPRWKREEPLILADETGIEAADISNRILIESLLDSMSPNMRAPLVLREIEGLEYEEIARIMQIPVGTVRSRLNTARSQFRKLWTSAMEETKNV